MNIIDTLQELYAKKGFICDMDGVIYHGNRLLPGVKEFVDWLYKEEKEFLFLTNSSERSPKELQQKLARMGLDVDESHFYTSALATAKFLASQSPKCSVYVIGAPGLVNALYDAGITMNDTNPDYVVVGETRAYNYDMILKAVSLLQKGARLVATNSDLTGPTETGIIPACRALTALTDRTRLIRLYIRCLLTVGRLCVNIYLFTFQVILNFLLAVIIDIDPRTGGCITVDGTNAEYNDCQHHCIL